MPRLLLATNNAGKVREFRALLANCGWEVVSPADISLTLEVDEGGSTYAENAQIKATAFAEASGLAALSDDSGLEMEALGGEPGPRHHVHGWDGIDNDDRIAILLRRLGEQPGDSREGRYEAVVVVALPDGRTLTAAGSCPGRIIDTPRGEGGFGYDPVFYLPELGRTMAELSFEEKNKVSHRARAAAAICGQLRQMVSSVDE